MTIKNLYPDSRPQSIYNVINGRPELPASSTFSRASEATYIDSNSVMQTAAVNEPRFNYTNGVFDGLLLENAGENLFVPSDFVQAGLPSVNFALYKEVDMGPLGLTRALYFDTIPVDDAPGYAYRNTTVLKDNIYCFSCFLKCPDKKAPIEGADFILIVAGNYGNDYIITQVSNDVWKVSAWARWTQGQVWSGIRMDPGRKLMYFAGFQVEQGTKIPSSYMETTTGTVTRAPDIFSLTTSSNLDGGYSLLLDSETTTQDFLYRIKSGPVGSKKVIAQLKNDQGTLDWVITAPDSTEQSAKIDGLYPQVGFVNGRVRTVSSFGAADGTVQNNYLYTTGLSFPTPAEVSPGANELEFGVPQTLKAVYLWNGQLSDTEAVSVIKGEYNVVPIEPIKGDSYSFVYNTDPEDKGVTSMDLPFINPTVSERVYWGDGTNARYEGGTSRPIPQHTYPYPGQYRIQITTDDGFDSVQLGGRNASVITRVDQWAPQYRAGASGPGFTGDGLANLLSLQYTNKTIPKFKYTGLTSIDSAFRNNGQVPPNGGINSSDPDWGWVPTNLPDVTNVNNAFYGVSQVPSDPAMETFPQLQTSDKLTSANYTFYGTSFPKFPTNGLPFSNTSGLKKWIATFAYMSRLVEIGVLDTSAATNFNQMFDNCIRLPKMPFMNFSNASRDGLDYAWNKCEKLEDPFPAISLGFTRQLLYTWNGCKLLKNFPLLDFKDVTYLFRTWYDCYALGKDQEFPAINTENVTSIDGAWFYNSGHKTFPKLNFDKLTFAKQAWYLNISLSTFPAIDFPECTDFTQTWANCYSMTTFPNVDVSKGQIFVSTWQTLKDLESFPALDFSDGEDFTLCWYETGTESNLFTTFPRVTPSNTYCFPKGITFERAWHKSPVLANFPQNAFSPAVTFEPAAFRETWTECDLTPQSIEYILVSLNANPSTNVELGLDGGTNAAKSTWTAAANTAFDSLIAKGWTIKFNA